MTLGGDTGDSGRGHWGQLGALGGNWRHWEGTGDTRRCHQEVLPAAMSPCPPVSLDAVRESLGVTQECHLVPCLATVTLLCQGALWALGTSRRHLVTAAGHQRHQALRYRRLARATAATTVAAAEATAEATAATATLGTLEEVTGHLRDLVAAVTEDLEVARGFPASTALLGDIVVALGTALGDEEGARRLERAAQALPGDE